MSGSLPVDEKTYTVLPGTRMGVITPEYLEKLAALLREHEVPFAKITSAQRFAIAGHHPAAAEAIWRALGASHGPKKPVGIHYIQACPGERWCKYGRQDSLLMGERLQEALAHIPLPAKTKVGVAGCPMNCTECFIRDLGVFGKKAGWTLVFGGNGGGVPRIGGIVAEGLGDGEVVELAEKCLRYYASHARKMERSGRFLARTSLDALKAAVLG